jgi:glycosyltransferase involved in cell wall biosynthesis
LEGMRCGTPVITSNTSSMPEIAKEAALLVDPLNVEDIANSSERLWNDKTLRAEFKKKGIARSAQFNWSKMSIEYSRIYSQVA